MTAITMPPDGNSRWEVSPARNQRPMLRTGSAVSDVERGVCATNPLLRADSSDNCDQNLTASPGTDKKKVKGSFDESVGPSSNGVDDKGGGLLRMGEKLFYLTAFAFSGPLLIMSNKNVLTNIGFAFPLSLSFLTLTFSWAVCLIAVRLGLVTLKQKVDRKFYMTNILPIGALSAGTIVLGMASYLYLTVSFVQMLKAFTPVMTLGFMASFGLARPTRPIFASVMVICLGTALAGIGELNFSLLGMSCMIGAQMCEALKLVFTQLMLKNFKFSVVESLYWVTPCSAAWVLLFASIIEFRRFDWGTFELILSNKGSFLLSCVMAISTNAINAVVIQHTNALMLKLVATARNGVLVLFNALVLGEVVTLIQFCGYSVSLVGFMCYNILNRRRQNSGK